MCVLLVLLTTIGISATYYVLAKRDKHRESQQRIQIAFDIILDDFADRLTTYTNRVAEFLTTNEPIQVTTFSYQQDPGRISSISFISTNLAKAAEELKRFAHVNSAQRMILYGVDKRLLTVYQQNGEQENIGIYVILQEGIDTYLPLDDPSELTPMLLGRTPIPDTSFPSGVSPSYEEDIPDTISTDLFTEGQQLGIRITAPLYQQETFTGVLIADISYTQSMVERYASLSKTEVNLFVGNQLSVGTLPTYTHFDLEVGEQLLSCEDILKENKEIEIFSASVDDQDYYQGQCAFRNAQGTIGAITASLSQNVEKQEIKKILTAVLAVSGMAIVVAFGFSVIFSRNTIRIIKQLITYINRISKGDIPNKITRKYKGEFNDVKQNLNILIDTMNSLLKEVDGLTQAVQEGKLDTRGTTETFAGDWCDLVVGINNVINAFVVPITITAEYINRIAKGDIPNKITAEYKGEFNDIKQNLNGLIETTQEITRLAEAMAAGNLTIRANERSDRDTLIQALNVMITRLNEVIITVKSTADTVASGSREIRVSSEEVSQGAAEQAATAQEVSSSMEEMAANIRQNASNALQTEKIAAQSAEYAEESRKVVAKTVAAMREISKKIGSIETIALQTHMLSLNATIEAAKAQEQGTGFAVVASEVRSLAQRSRITAEEINNLVNSSLAISEKAGEMLDALVPNIHRTAELVREISAASDEQSTGTAHINTAIQQLNQVIQQNASTADEMTSMAEMLARQAEQLQDAMAFFRSDDADDTSIGYVTGIDKNKAEGDDLDVEFEKY
jgi:methyl-accepting chemotaxis protein